MISQSNLRPNANYDTEKDELGVDEGEVQEEVPGRKGEMKDGIEELPEEARTAVAVRDPYTPTAKEKREHDLTHANFRIWCKHCCMGRGTRTPTEHSKRMTKPIASQQFMQVIASWEATSIRPTKRRNSGGMQTPTSSKSSTSKTAKAEG